MDRIRLAFKVLFTPKIIVVTKGEQYCTFNDTNIVQGNNKITIEVKY